MKRTSKRSVLVAALLAAGALAGCVPAWPYMTLAQHTTRVAADRDADVVWLESIQGGVYRCTNSTEGPTCQRVKVN